MVEWIVEVAGISYGGNCTWKVGTRDGHTFRDVAPRELLFAARYLSGNCGDPRRGVRPRFPVWVTTIGEEEVPPEGTPALFSHQSQMLVIPIADPVPGARHAIAAEGRYRAAIEKARKTQRELAEHVESSVKAWMRHHPEIIAGQEGPDLVMDQMIDDVYTRVMETGELSADFYTEGTTQDVYGAENVEEPPFRTVPEWSPDSSALGATRWNKVSWRSSNPQLADRLKKARKAARKLDAEQ